jgi:bacillithiol biosynthesis cysteine-adding enzyme BshC
MKSHCLPFRQIPHASRLFLDYLEFTTAIKPFYSSSPRFLEWAGAQKQKVEYPAERRARVAKILERQNRAWGAGPKTLANIEQFRKGAYAIVTGQQVGLLGGPVFSIFKALSTVKLAREAERLGIACVPVFWLATEDHDLAEVNQVRLPNAEGRLETLAASLQAMPDAPVGTVKFGPEIGDVLARAGELLGESEWTRWLVESYRSGEDFGSAFAKLYTRVFAEFGVILLDGSDPELDEIASPLYKSVIENAAELAGELIERGKQLETAGYHQQVRVTDSSTLLFMIHEERRIPIHQADSGDFLAGEHKIERQELERLASSSPQSLSPNVLLRPVVQDFLLPTLAYCGGAAETAYFAQANVVYGKLLGRATPVVPRFSATVVEPKINAILGKYGLAAPAVFQGPEILREELGARRLPPNLQSSFEQATIAVQHSMKTIRELLEKLDKTLVESAENAEGKMIYQINNLRARSARAELRQSEVIGRHAEILSNALYPDKTLQEREYGGIYFLSKYGSEFMTELLDAMHPDCLDHQIIEL